VKKLIVLLAFAFGVVAIGGGLYARLGDTAPQASISYFGNGEKKSAVEYIDGIKQGAAEQWYSNGRLECQGRYRDGLRDGPWQFWNEDGTLDLGRSGEYGEGRKL